MGLTYLPFKPEHINFVAPAPVQLGEYQALILAGAYIGAGGGISLSAWSGSRCIGVGGVAVAWPGRAEMWGIFGTDCGRHMLALVFKMRFVLDTYPCRRIELTVKRQNEEGNRIAGLLGFGPPEGLMRAYHPDGSDMYLYARIK